MAPSRRDAGQLPPVDFANHRGIQLDPDAEAMEAYEVVDQPAHLGPVRQTCHYVVLDYYRADSQTASNTSRLRSLGATRVPPRAAILTWCDWMQAASKTRLDYTERFDVTYAELAAN